MNSMEFQHENALNLKKGGRSSARPSRKRRYRSLTLRHKTLPTARLIATALQSERSRANTYASEQHSDQGHDESGLRMVKTSLLAEQYMQKRPRLCKRSHKRGRVFFSTLHAATSSKTNRSIGSYSRKSKPSRHGRSVGTYRQALLAKAQSRPLRATLRHAPT